MKKYCIACQRIVHAENMRKWRKTIDGKDSVQKSRSLYQKNVKMDPVRSCFFFKKEAEKQRKYQKRKRESGDLSFITKERVRARFRRALKERSSSSEELIGCSWDMLLNHVGEYNPLEDDLDHIIPCALFNFSDNNEIKACFHYTNLQRLSKHENRRYKDKFKGINQNWKEIFPEIAERIIKRVN